MTELDKIKAEIEPYINTLVIADNYTVARLVGVVDGDLDYYWLYDGVKGMFQESCCGGFTPLKGFIPNYEYMVAIWNRNNIEKAV